mmetsp:Transcript_22047/g.45638  ORF Transcript_22047/g.45638 Transcript_22047/m.45638 type:complete len:387 (-) Transcript_22047:495-1655(-)
MLPRARGNHRPAEVPQDVSEKTVQPGQVRHPRLSQGVAGGGQRLHVPRSLHRESEGSGSLRGGGGRRCRLDERWDWRRGGGRGSRRGRCYRHRPGWSPRGEREEGPAGLCHARLRKAVAGTEKCLHKTPSDASKSTKNACAVPGCTKQSQGARNGYMCRKCYRLSVAPPHMPAPARRARKSAGGVPGSAKAASAAKSNRPACSIPGCPKQSQGRASNYMCRKCFMQYQKGGGIAMPEVETAAAAAAAAVAAQMPTDPELAEMVRKEVQRIKRLQQGDEDCDAGSAPKRSRQEASSTAAVSAIVAQRKQAHERAAQLGTELRAARAAELSLEQALQGMASCVKCQVEPKTVSLAPCGHLVYCDSCSSGENECPICLSSIEEARHVAV